MVKFWKSHHSVYQAENMGYPVDNYMFKVNNRNTRQGVKYVQS